MQMNSFENSEIFDNEICMHNLSSDALIPDSINWIDLGYRNPVLYQGGCGSCYIFSVVDAIEGEYYIKYKKLIRLSQQEIVDCRRTRYGCGGGSRPLTLKYIKTNGITYNEYYPYTGKEGECKNLTKSPRITIIDYKAIQKGNEESLKEAVATVGIVSVAVNSGLRSFKFYKSGVYYDKDCLPKLLHAVTIVGYGNENGQEYWLVKNSWSSKWGDKGFIKIARNRNSHCGIADQAMYPIV